MRGARRVLVVDDNKDVVAVLTVLVNLAGYEVRTAYDGQAAVALAEEFLPEVVLMDLEMPFMNGLEAAKYIRHQAWGETMLLIAVSGRGQKEDRQQAEAAGFDLHLVKPVEMAKLQCILRNFTRE